MPAVVCFFLIFLQTTLSFAGANRIVTADQFQSSDLTKTWTPPSATDTLTGNATPAILTNKTISGASNTITNIPSSALSLSASAPLSYLGGNFSISQSSAISDGYLSSTDWASFAAKQAPIASYSAPTHQFINAYAAGAFSAAQPAFSDLSGQIAGSQVANGTITNGMLVNSSSTVAGVSCALGGSCNLTSTTAIQKGNGTGGFTAAVPGTDYQAPLTIGNLTGSAPVSVSGGMGAVIGSGASVSMPQANASTDGYLSQGDWSTFNGKQNALTFGNLSAAGTDGISVTGGSGAVIGSGTSLSQQKADATHNGYLSQGDWSTFNSKQAALTPGSISSSTTGVTVGNGASSTVGPNVTVNIQTASGSQPGLLSSSDWTTFNSKEPAIAAGTALQYWRGDKTFQTLNTTAVPEGTNQYFTAARFQSTAKANASAQYFKVSKDAGNDANDCSIFAPCKTIQAGINAANAVSAYYKQTVVIVEPSNGGTGYAENITLSQQGVNLECEANQAASRACLVTGTVTVNLNGTSGGVNFIAALNDAAISGFTIVGNSASQILYFTGTQYQRLTLTNTYVQNNGTGSAVAMDNTIANSKLIGYDPQFESNNASSATVNITNGNLWMYGSFPNVNNNTANARAIDQAGGYFICNICNITGQYNVTSNVAVGQISNSNINSGTASSIQLPASPSTGYVISGNNLFTTSNTNTIAGAGVMAISSGNFCGGTGCAIQNTVTVSNLSRLPEGVIKPSGLLVSGLTASQPVLTDANKNLVSGLIANSNMATMAQATIKGRASGAGTGSPQDLTGTQATAILDTFTSTLKGLAPASGGGTANFLRADGTWAAPSGSGVSSISVATANGLSGVSSGGSTPQLTLSTTVSGIVKGNGTALSAAVSGTDYAPATSGTSILKGSGTGGFSNAVAKTDYVPATAGTAIQKADGVGGLTAAVSGTDYAPATSGSSILYGNGAGGFSNVTVGSGLTFSGGTLSATGSGGTVTSVSVASANGFSGTVLNPTTTPQITMQTTVTGLLQGNGTAVSAASTTGTGSVVLANSPTISGAWGSPDSIQFNTGATVTPAQGKLFWDGFSTLDVGMDANVNQQIGESQFYYIKADAAITKGQVIMFTGANGGSGVLKGAPATGVTNGDYIMGVAAENIALNGFGFVQSFGLIKNVDTSAYLDGDVLWYDPTVTGGFTKVRPVAPNIKTVVAAVVNGGSAGGGSIYIRVNDGGDLNHLSDVQTSSPVSGQILKYNGTNWVNASVNALSTEVQEVPSGSINNSNVAFTLAHTPISNGSVKLYQDGLILRQGTDYTISGTGITMTTAPNFGQRLYADYNY